MHRFRGLREELFDVARGLADAVLVLDQRDADEAFAVFAEARGRATPRRRPSRSAAWQNSTEPRSRNGSGIGAQANIVAGGGGMFQPARPKLSTRQSRRRL